MKETEKKDAEQKAIDDAAMVEDEMNADPAPSLPMITSAGRWSANWRRLLPNAWQQQSAG